MECTRRNLLKGAGIATAAGMAAAMLAGQDAAALADEKKAEAAPTPDTAKAQA